MGLSDDAKMGEDLTTECVPENGRVNLYSSYTSASPYSAVRANVVSSIKSRHKLLQFLAKISRPLSLAASELGASAECILCGWRHLLQGAT